MSISGPNALRAIEEALRDIRGDEDEITRRLSHSSELVMKLREQEGGLLNDLAASRLPPATAKTLSDTIRSALDKARLQLEANADALKAAEAKLESLDADLAKASAERASLEADAAKRDSELERLAAKVRPVLSGDLAFEEKRRIASRLATIAAESQNRAAQAEADREHEGQAYRDDKLFMYLRERGYSTKNYRANPLSGFFDGKLAELIGFPTARANFAALNELPLRYRDHTDAQKQKADAAAAELAALEQAAIDAAGGGAARTALHAIVTRIEEVDGHIVQLQDQRDDISRNQRELMQGGDPLMAAPSLADVLGGDTHALLSGARMTPDTADSIILQQLDDLRQRSNEEADETLEQKGRLKVLAQRRRELEDIQYEFKALSYDSPRSRFAEDGLIGNLLNEYLRGEMTAAVYWDRWRKNQSWDSGTSDQAAAGSGSKFSRPRQRAKQAT